MARTAYAFKKTTKQIQISAVTLSGVSDFWDKDKKTAAKTPNHH